MQDLLIVTLGQLREPVVQTKTTIYIIYIFIGLPTRLRKSENIISFVLGLAVNNRTHQWDNSYSLYIGIMEPYIL